MHCFLPTIDQFWPHAGLSGMEFHPEAACQCAETNNLPKGEPVLSLNCGHISQTTHVSLTTSMYFHSSSNPKPCWGTWYRHCDISQLLLLWEKVSFTASVLKSYYSASGQGNFSLLWKRRLRSISICGHVSVDRQWDLVSWHVHPKAETPTPGWQCRGSTSPLADTGVKGNMPVPAPKNITYSQLCRDNSNEVSLCLVNWKGEPLQIVTSIPNILR